jgi:hypothetical protein
LCSFGGNEKENIRSGDSGNSRGRLCIVGIRNSQKITDSQKITGRHFMITPHGYHIPEVSS